MAGEGAAPSQGKMRNLSCERAGNVGNGFGEDSPSLTELTQSVCLFANPEIRNADLEMPWDRRGIAERGMELETRFK